MKLHQLVIVSLVTLAVAGLAWFAIGQVQLQKPEPPMQKAELAGQLIDFTCATRSYGMTGKWVNASNQHVLPGTGGKTAERCSEMCLKGGQPAALFDGENVMAIFTCNPRTTLANYAGQQVEVQGFWTHRDSRAFLPEKIRAVDGDWEDVFCATLR